MARSHPRVTSNPIHVTLGQLQADSSHPVGLKSPQKPASTISKGDSADSSHPVGLKSPQESASSHHRVTSSHFRGAPGLVMGPCIVEIHRIVIRIVQYQFEVNRSPGLVIAPCIVEIDCIVIKEVQYQFEVNQCRNEEIIVKGNFG
ncbi:hypothetical protein DPMN_031883 [Dreissena polymorpha]|uniref:Uncharacterized protein n=1 Tax=Dreissena polymorpha TaxID=45954 RepID=A0A9D4M356_DREPO|nr:hypothetical protein DPMN_031883 [Dreissena polymorpha]